MTVYEKLKTIDIDEMTLLFMAFAAKCIRDAVGEKIEDIFIGDERNYIEVKKWLESEADENADTCNKQKG